MSDLINRAKAMKSLQDNLGVDRSEENLTTEAATHDKRTETHGVCSDLISRADIEYHTQLEARGNGQYEAVEVAYKSDIDNLPSADTDMSEYSDKLWKAAYERGKAAMSQYVMDIIELLFDENMVARVREWIDDIPSEGDVENATTTGCACNQTFNQLATESKLKNPCDSLLTGDAAECKEQESKLDCIRRQAVVGIINLMLDEDTAELIRGYIDDLPSVTPTERTGKWVFRLDIPIDGGAESAGYVCSECGADVFRPCNFCPNCGAKMGGDTE